MVAKLGETAIQSGKNNVAFLSHFLLGDLEKCLDVLIESGRLPEAAFFARTYLPSQISRVLPQWKEQLTKVSEKAGQSLADPNEYKNLFSNFEQLLPADQSGHHPDAEAGVHRAGHGEAVTDRREWQS